MASFRQCHESSPGYLVVYHVDFFVPLFQFESCDNKPVQIERICQTERWPTVTLLDVEHEKVKFQIRAVVWSIDRLSGYVEA